MKSHWPLIVLVAIQFVDLFLHVSTGQFEPIRLASNLVIGCGAIWASRAKAGTRKIILGSGLGYLALNLLFLLQNGATNPMNGNLRLPLFVFMLASVLALIWLQNSLKRQAS